MKDEQLKNIIEAALLAAGQPLSIDRVLAIFPEDEQPERTAVRDAFKQLEADCKDRGIELKKVSSGYRLQVRQEMSPWILRLWEERPSRYSRALMETLALVAYRQPVTRAEIEDVRGVSVSSSIMKTLLEREWVRVVGHRDVPGKPAMFGTTRQFLDYFGLTSLDDLPKLAEITDIDSFDGQLELSIAEDEAGSADNAELDNAESDIAETPVDATDDQSDEIGEQEHQSADVVPINIKQQS